MACRGGKSLLRDLIAGAVLAALSAGCAALVRGAKQDLIRVHPAGSSEVAITLDNSFIETYKDRVTIDVAMTVGRADTRPHPALVDGDFHVAGNSREIGLAFVAEIQNAAKQKEASDLVRAAEAAGDPIDVAGVWRLWVEHAGEADEVQGEGAAAETTNPEHVFEIHPVVRLSGLDLLASLRPVRGYRPGTADLVFRGLERIPCRISPGEKTTTIVAPGTRLNDVEFVLEVGNEPPRVVADGRFVAAAVLDRKGTLLAKSVRMVFVKDSPAEQLVRALPAGGRLHVFGLPRISLNEIASRVAGSRERPELLSLGLPYEIIVSGAYADPK